MNSFKTALEHIARIMDSLGTGPDFWGLTHTDLQGSNLIVSGEHLCPIDFSLSGFGHFLFDLGLSLISLKAELRSHVLAGYRSCASLPEGFEDALEGFGLLSVLSCIAIHLPNPARHDWLRDRFIPAARTYCRQFMEGEPFVLVEG